VLPTVLNIGRPVAGRVLFQRPTGIEIDAR
jgi:hypothetical protein